MQQVLKDVKIVENLGDEFEGHPGFVYQGNTFVFADIESVKQFIETSSDEDLNLVIQDSQGTDENKAV